MKTDRIINYAAWAVLLTALCLPARAYKVELSEETKKLSLEQQEKLINAEMQQSHELQLKVGRERSEERQAVRQAMGAEMAAETSARRELISRVRVARIEQEEAAHGQQGIILLSLGLVIAGLLSFFVIQRWRERARNIAEEALEL